jgi:hypothetical protein
MRPIWSFRGAGSFGSASNSFNGAGYPLVRVVRRVPLMFLATTFVSWWFFHVHVWGAVVAACCVHSVLFRFMGMTRCASTGARLQGSPKCGMEGSAVLRTGAGTAVDRGSARGVGRSGAPCESPQVGRSPQPAEILFCDAALLAFRTRSGTEIRPEQGKGRCWSIQGRSLQTGRGNAGPGQAQSIAQAIVVPLSVQPLYDASDSHLSAVPSRCDKASGFAVSFPELRRKRKADSLVQIPEQLDPGIDGHLPRAFRAIGIAEKVPGIQTHAKSLEARTRRLHVHSCARQVRELRL